MRKIRFICRKCGHKFEADVFEEGEAAEKKRPTAPIRCPKCRGPVEKL
jgi:DNA-directed RNA polymerase subunit RPC12/RpoP